MLILKDLLDRYSQLDSEPLLQIVAEYYLYDEKEYVDQLKSLSHIEPELEYQIEEVAQTIIATAASSKHTPLINQVLSEYQLNQNEGTQLLALAEGLLRIKSSETAQRFLQDKIVHANWDAHKHQSEHSAVNLATQGLSLLKQWLTSSDSAKPFNYWLSAGKNKLAQEALKLLISKLAGVFIKGSSISSALEKPNNDTQHCCSFDMLGEAALTEEDADRYLDNYMLAIDAVAMHQDSSVGNQENSLYKHSVSIKLSALTPKFQYRYQREGINPTFFDRIERLVRSAHEQSVAITLDAEEADQLELTLEIFKRLFLLPGLKGWGNLGIAIQAYGFRAIPSLLFLRQLAKEHQTPIPVRLVKGAYWDTEINKAQELGLTGYPVFTQKSATDMNYQYCAKLMLQAQLDGFIKPQFATHNGVTVATVLKLADELDPNKQALFPLEFQRLHGMGESVYQSLYEILEKDLKNTDQSQKENDNAVHKLLQGPIYYCRSYCPVGPYNELLPYLIRRILENGANQSFLNLMSQNHDNSEQDQQRQDNKNQDKHPWFKLPYHNLIHYDRFRPEFPLPKDIYLPELQGSQGYNLNHPLHIQQLGDFAKTFQQSLYESQSCLAEQISLKEQTAPLYSPNDQNLRLGLSHTITDFSGSEMSELLHEDYKWKEYSPEQRTQITHQFAVGIKNNEFELIQLLIHEAGKTWSDAISEIREAIDFCYYYLAKYEAIEPPKTLPHTANERNTLRYLPKGNFLCISPWNFPIAILVGQVIAALITGNRVIIKPAPQTQLCGLRVYELLINAGVPKDSVIFFPANNQASEKLVGIKGIDGIAFTGSLNTARSIQRSLFEHHPYPIPLIAETSGLNCMITDDTILTEQMVKDVVTSAFGSAGQRCSALRVLFLHQSVYQESIDAIIGVMKQLKVDHPNKFSTDLGPIIDQNALAKLTNYIEQRKDQGRLLYQQAFSQQALSQQTLEPHLSDSKTKSSEAKELSSGFYLSPALISLNNLSDLEGEQFGPILHVIPYQSEQIDDLIHQIESSDYALTLGIHSRDQHWVDYLCSKLSMGNIYINRHITGAQVGAQPFGGSKRSGTGFKAGGPNYLLQFVNEQCISENLAAVGGNTELITKANS